MEQLTDVRVTLKGAWRGYQGMTLEQAAKLYRERFKAEPRQWAIVPPDMLLLGPIEEKGAQHAATA